MASSAQNVPEEMMKSENDVRDLEKLIVQLQGLHTEIGLLAKRSPNDGLNLFKLKLVNNILTKANSILIGHYKPLEDFSTFVEAALPTNSDVTMILTLYMEQAERYRSNNIDYDSGSYKYVIDGKASDIVAKTPTRIGMDKK